MRDVTALVLRLHPREQVPMRNGIIDHNRTHRGQAGSAAIRYEDWQTSRLYGTSWVLRHPEHGLIYSLSMRQRVSEMLDWISPLPGATLVRTADRWDANVPCGGRRRLRMPRDPESEQPCPLDSQL